MAQTMNDAATKGYKEGGFPLLNDDTAIEGTTHPIFSPLLVNEALPLILYSSPFIVPKTADWQNDLFTAENVTLSMQEEARKSVREIPKNMELADDWLPETEQFLKDHKEYFGESAFTDNMKRWIAFLIKEFQDTQTRKPRIDILVQRLKLK